MSYSLLTSTEQRGALMFIGVSELFKVAFYEDIRIKTLVNTWKIPKTLLVVYTYMDITMTCAHNLRIIITINVGGGCHDVTKSAFFGVRILENDWK